MKSAANKRSIRLDGHKTSISLEDAFWTELKEIARFQGVTVSSLVAAIAATRKESNLSSAIRFFVLENKNKRARPPHSARQLSAVMKAKHLRLGAGLQDAANCTAIVLAPGNGVRYSDDTISSLGSFRLCPQ